MLVIRQEQMKVFEEQAQLDFEDAVVAHIRDHFPDDFSQLQAPGVRDLLPKAMADAQSFGISRHRDVMGWVSLMITLGPDFHKDPEHDWAQEILNSALLDPDSKIDCLFEELLARLES